MIRRTIPSIDSAVPNITPARMQSSVRVPITFVRRDQLRVRQPRRPPKQRLRRRAHARRDHAAEEHAVARDAVERRGGAEVHHDRIALIAAAREQRVDDPVGAHGARLVDRECDRERRLPSKISEPLDRQPPPTRLGEVCRHAADDRRDRDAVSPRASGTSAPAMSPRSSTPTSSAVRGVSVMTRQCARSGRAVEEAKRRLGVADVEGQEHVRGSAKVSDPERCATTPSIRANEKFARGIDSVHDALTGWCRPPAGQRRGRARANAQARRRTDDGWRWRPCEVPARCDRAR